MSELFINPSGVLCRLYISKGFWSKICFDLCEIDVIPVIDGIACDGVTVINEDDYHYEPSKSKMRT